VIVMGLVELSEEAYGSLGDETVLADCPYNVQRGQASCVRCLMEALYGFGPVELAGRCERRRWAEMTATVSGHISHPAPAFVGLQSIFTVLREPEGGDTKMGTGDEDSFAQLVWAPGPIRLV